MIDFARARPWLLALAALLAACSGESAESLVASAKQYLAQDNAKAAVIQLKNAVQADPEAAEARFLLGKALLDTGDVGAASIELRKALSLRHPESQVAPLLAQTMILEGRHQLLVEQFGQSDLPDPIAQADLKTALAVAYGALGKREMAQRSLEAALTAVPDFGPAVLFQARIKADSGDVDGALAAVERIVTRAPQDHEAWQLQGDLLAYGKRDFPAALAAYRQAVSVKPNYVPAHAAALTLLLGGAGTLDEAKTQLEALTRVAPGHPQTRYFEASVALREGQLDRAQELAQNLLRVAPTNPRILQLSGAVEFQRGSFGQAESLLAKTVQLAPGNVVARRLLALTYLRTARPASALEALQPLLDHSRPDPSALSLAGQAHLQAGDLVKAEASFALAAKINPADTRNRTALAISRVAKGETEAGISDLRGLAEDDKGTTADLPLISALVRKKDYAGALKAIDALERKIADSPVPANLRARVLAIQGNAAGARKEFERALQKNAAFYPAVAALAAMDLADGKVDGARKRFDDVLTADPRNMQALLASAELKARTGASPQEVLQTFTAAVQRNPELAPARLQLIAYHRKRGDAKAALQAAQEAAAALPQSAEILEALGLAQAAAGDRNQAISSFNQLAQMQRNLAQPQLRLAEVHAAAKDFEAALQALQRALAIEPEHLVAQGAVVDVYLKLGRPDQALAMAREIRKQRPKQHAGPLAEAIVHLSQKDWGAAIQALRDGLTVAPDATDLAARLHSALSAAGKAAEADRYAAAWLKTHPQDATFYFHLGDTALSRGDLAQAETNYRQVLRVQPKHALALNNVAWLMAKAKKPGAVAMAEKANQLLADRPAIMDTLATALAAEGQPGKGVEVLRKALAIDGDNAPLRLNLAKILIQAGDKAAARTELEALVKLGDKFPLQQEVAQTLKAL